MQCSNKTHDRLIKVPPNTRADTIAGRCLVFSGLVMVMFFTAALLSRPQLYSCDSHYDQTGVVITQLGLAEEK